MRVFFVQNFFAKNHNANVIREKLLNLRWYEKPTCKLLMKLTPAVEAMRASFFYVARSGCVTGWVCFWKCVCVCVNERVCVCACVYACALNLSDEYNQGYNSLRRSVYLQARCPFVFAWYVRVSWTQICDWMRKYTLHSRLIWDSFQAFSSIFSLSNGSSSSSAFICSFHLWWQFLDYSSGYSFIQRLHFESGAFFLTRWTLLEKGLQSKAFSDLTATFNFSLNFLIIK